VIPRRRLKQVASITVSNVDKKAVEDERPVRLCNYTDVYYNERITADLPFMEATATRDQVAQFALRKGDVLITKDSETADDIAVPAYVTEDMPDVLCGYHLAVVRSGHGTDSTYLFWALASRSAREQFSASATGVTRFGLRYEALGDVLIPWPSRPERLAIADYLDAETARIDALIEKKRRLIKLIDERLGVYIRDRLLATSAPTRPLKRTWTVIDCKHRTPNYVDSGYPVVSPGDATPGRLDLSRAHRFVDKDDLRDLTADGRGPKRGDVIYSRNASIGIASFVDTDTQFCMGQDVCLVTSRDADQLYLTYVLNTLGADQLDVQKIGSTFSRVNISQIVELQLPTPALDEQKAIAAELDEQTLRRDRAVNGLVAQLDLFVEHRQTLITAAVTGELDIQGVAA